MNEKVPLGSLGSFAKLQLPKAVLMAQMLGFHPQRRGAVGGTVGLPNASLGATIGTYFGPVL